MLIVKDLRELFDYVEPADVNLSCFSFRIHSLLLRACIEVEANCKAILQENKYDPRKKSDKWSMTEYRNIERSHRMSEFQVQLPHWHGHNEVRSPFAVGESR